MDKKRNNSKGNNHLKKNTELVNTALILNENGENVKIKFLKVKKLVNSFEIFLETGKRSTPKLIELLFKQVPELADEEFPLLVLSENLYGDPAVVEIGYNCNKLKFDAKNLEDYNIPLVPGTRLAIPC